MKVKYAKNGLILETEDGTIVYQEEGSNESDIKRFADFLWAINESFGPSTSRYSAERIYISVRPGDKHEDYKSEDEEQE